MPAYANIAMPTSIPVFLSMRLFINRIAAAAKYTNRVMSAARSNLNLSGSSIYRSIAIISIINAMLHPNSASGSQGIAMA